MSRKFTCLFALLLMVGVVATPALVAQETVGAVVFDVGFTPGDSEFDIFNFTAPNLDSPDSNPIVSEVDLSSLSLTVNFSSGPADVFGSSYFTLDADGISWDGNPMTSSTFTNAISAVLTGTFVETSMTLGDSSTFTANPGFTSTITDAGGLKDGDSAAIIATAGTSGPPPATPEPESLVMVATGIAGLAGYRRRMLLAAARKFSRGAVGSVAALAIVGLLAASPVSANATVATVKLGAATVPGTGLAGYNTVAVSGSGFPGGTISPASVTVSFATSCGGTVKGSDTATAVSTLVGTTDRVTFLVPASLTAGTYYVSLSGAVTSSNCSVIQVTATTTTLAACVPTSSLAVTVGTNVNAYVPFGYWESSTSGIEEVPLEGSGTAQGFSTAGAVNSCAANSTTGEVVCTENSANVDLINGSALTTVTSGSDQFTGFSGGSCENCGVGVNAGTNTAVIGMGLSTAPSGSGVQVLNLATNTFNTPFPLSNQVSEDVSIDSGRGLILSPNEGGNYDLLKIGSGSSLTEYSNFVGESGALDSAAEDCTTGIALAADEFSDDIYITDLTQATFGSTTWSAPGQFFQLNDGGYSAGTCGISSAPGTGHLAVVTGEFGGSSYSALQLPSTSGSGTPTLADYAYVGSMPSTPDGNGFTAGFDPHTVTAYTSPNNSKSYAVFADYEGIYIGVGHPNYLGVVDLACVLALPRTAGTHTVADGTAASCTRYVVVP
jgi:hypothetical protein